MRPVIKQLLVMPPGVDPHFYRAFRLVCFVGLLIHFGFIFFFLLLGVSSLALFNVVSVLLWAGALILAQRSQLLMGFALLSLEIIAHAVIAVLVLGWSSGFQQYLIPLTICVFLLRKRPAFSIVVGGLTTITFIALYYYDLAYPVAAGMVLSWFYIPNTLGALGLAVAAVSYYVAILDRAEADLLAAHRKSEGLLTNILPQVIAERLKRTSGIIADNFPETSVLFADIESFTPFSEHISPVELVQLLGDIFSRFDDLVAKHRLEKIKTIGDAYMVAAGVPISRPDHAEALALFALEMRAAIANYNQERGMKLKLRIGINSGPVVAGVIGKLRFLYDLWGDSVNTASRMESHGIAGEIQVTEATHNLLKDRFIFEDRGLIDVKGKGRMRTYLLKGPHDNDNGSAQ
jgi:adenylate cyclase